MSTHDLSKAHTQKLKRSSNIENLPERFEAWLKAKFSNADNIELQSFDPTSADSGRSAEMYIASVRWQDTSNQNARHQKFVVRNEANAPTNAFSNTNHMISLIKILNRETDLPIPKLYWAEHDVNFMGGPFCVMEFVDGVVASDSPPFTSQGWVYDATSDQRRKMYRSGIQFLVDLHKVDWEALGLDFMIRRDDAKSHTESIVTRAIEVYNQAVDGKSYEFEEATIKWLRDNLPADENLRISWNDSRPGNILWKDYELNAALDWEMATLLDPSFDVSLWLYADYNFAESIGIKRLPGMLERDEFLATYEELGGTKLVNFNYFEVFSAFQSHVAVAHLLNTWEKHGQHFYGEGINIENAPTRKSFIEIAGRHI